MKRKIFGLTMAMAMLVPVGVLAAGSAGAAAKPLVTCAKPSGTLTASPGLSLVPHIETLTINLPLKSCKGGGVTGGTSKGKSVGTKPGTCLTFYSDPASTKVTVTITWAGGKGTSTFAVTTTVKAGKPLTATVAGTISKGLFKGHKVSTKVAVSFKGSCTKTTAIKTVTVVGVTPFTIT